MSATSKTNKVKADKVKQDNDVCGVAGTIWFVGTAQGFVV